MVVFCLGVCCYPSTLLLQYLQCVTARWMHNALQSVHVCDVHRACLAIWVLL
jgi:hypothetical protein